MTTSNQEAWRERLEEAVRLHQQGVDGNQEAVVRAYEILTELRNQNLENSLIDAYYGSTLALLGRDAILPAEKMQKAMNGLEILDEAVSKDPQNLTIRLLRGHVCNSLPDMFFQRTKTAVEDFTYILDAYQQDPGLFPKPFIWQLLYDLGMAHKKVRQEDEAKECWNQLLSETDDPKYVLLLEQEGVDITNMVPPSLQKKAEEAKRKAQEVPFIPEEIMTCYQRGLDGDEKAARKAYQYFAVALKADPVNLWLQAYHADCLSLMGRDASNTMELFGNTILAIKTFNGLVKCYPNNIHLRLMRANHSMRLPEAFFYKTTSAIEDYCYVIEQYERKPSILPQKVYFRALYDLSRALDRMDLTEQAERVREKLLAKKPGDEFVKMVEEDRQRYRLDPFKVQVVLLDKERTCREGKKIFLKAVKGNSKMVDTVYNFWRLAHEKYPDDPIVKAYYGMSLALTGRDTRDSGKMLPNAIMGLQIVNEAVSKASKNPELRLLRGYLYYSLPKSFFPLTDQAVKDFEFVLHAYERNPSLLSTETYHQLLYDTGKAYERLGDLEKARQHWRKLRSESTDPRFQVLDTEGV
jgi:tetratricopeptide (TPR) repeat protein